MSNYAKFHNYFDGENHDPARDRIFMNNTVLMMSDTEFDQFLGEMHELLLKYNFQPGDKRKARDISIISSPVEKN